MPPKKLLIDEDYDLYLSSLQSLSYPLLVHHLNPYRFKLQSLFCVDVAFVVVGYCDSDIAQLVTEYIGTGRTTLRLVDGYTAPIPIYDMDCRLLKVNSTRLFVEATTGWRDVVKVGQILELTAFADIRSKVIPHPLNFPATRREWINRRYRKQKLLFHPASKWIQPGTNTRLYFGSLLRDECVTELPITNQLEFLLRRSNAMNYEW
jgi:hypothetical protein